MSVGNGVSVTTGKSVCVADGIGVSDGARVKVGGLVGNPTHPTHTERPMNRVSTTLKNRALDTQRDPLLIRKLILSESQRQSSFGDRSVNQG